MKSGFLLLAIVLLFISSIQAEYFVFSDSQRSEFVIELTDPKKIEHARDLISGKTSSQTHLLGRIVKSSAKYNAMWSFTLDPTTIYFFEVAVEVCDASVGYVEDHLDEACGAFLPGCIWCPWSSQLLREITE